MLITVPMSALSFAENWFVSHFSQWGEPESIPSEKNDLDYGQSDSVIERKSECLRCNREHECGESERHVSGLSVGAVFRVRGWLR